jgi:acetyl-CoA carboxylase carboxyl transferase subunit beta|uniref:Acetyl-coenzyme A carboxylase carboxyl transferase subunit beta, chloroplastic n=3 Tax=Chlorella vulgaris TaxID=3077 RepID=ACCD_CHLVU|nr:acetyl-CoA carboxylase beta subunit [Chlorella vulgaris]P56293.1 RecName: Full=Acetyl-coenzyme A carboxylase carboxyl transferase subunit beta, chloroplastic; Short=ACCase subunit beta; Short=Acetyl-CoA carboxylase carboxyltransferase subunit beta [Chlorella vulgaris]QGN74951.1 beta subunit of acetyl-CoA carboxylase carboxytransferase [Chlorella vulgaris]QSJ54213.1 beta subunit of acetyl-CoA carboxylase carboxytransferase [Chlorella vulgaris]QSV10876.1 beta subunit of acetyl-CoA carboxylase 
MSILSWIENQRKLKLLNAPKYNHPESDVSQGLWTRCDHCGVILYIKHLKENQRVCFGCGYHLQMSSTERIESLVDANTWRPFDEMVSPCDPLEFRDQKAYTERLKDAQERTGLQDAVQTGTGLLDGIPIALGVMDFHFMGGSMGSVVGEKITRLIEYATQEGLPVILVCASGGARMQEGILSLMQMAKISAALHIHQNCAKLLYISVLTSPTTGGVTASFAMLGDLLFAEPKALIGFAGRRVIEQTLQEQLPDDFQTAEYLLHHGLLDLIVPRSFLKQALSETLTLYKEAPLKEQGRIPYGERGPLTKTREEQLRRFLKSSKTPEYLHIVNDLKELLGFLGQTQTTLYPEKLEFLNNLKTQEQFLQKNDNFFEELLTSTTVKKALNLACGTQTRLNWLNYKLTEFRIRPKF